jgi:myo-inositol-1-phosphate synthase
MGTIRLGKRTDSKSPLIKDFVPLASLNDLVFTGWDIFEDNVYESAAHAKVLDKETLDQLKPYLETIKPLPAVFDQYYVKRLQRHARQEGQEQARPGRSGHRRHPRLQEDRGPRGDDLVRFDRDFHRADGCP